MPRTADLHHSHACLVSKRIEMFNSRLSPSWEACRGQHPPDHAGCQGACSEPAIGLGHADEAAQQQVKVRQHELIFRLRLAVICVFVCVRVCTAWIKLPAGLPKNPIMRI